MARIVAAAEAEWRWSLDGVDDSGRLVDELAIGVEKLRTLFKPFAVAVASGMLAAFFWRALREGRARERTRPRVDPIAEWDGNEAVKTRLSELWERYRGRRVVSRYGGETMAEFVLSEDLGRMTRELWRERGPERYIFYVNYARPVRYRVGDSSAKYE